MRRRYIAVGNKWVEVGCDYAQPAKNADAVLWNDRSYDGMKSHLDGTDISSRSKHREYMRAKGLTTIDDFTETNAKNQKARDDFYSGKQGTGAVRKEDIARAIRQLENK